MAKLRGVKKFLTSQFAHDQDDKMFSAEASALGLPPGLPLSQLYDDAIDVGLELVSTRTEKVSTWYLGETTPDHIVLYPTHESERAFPGLLGYRMYIFND